MAPGIVILDVGGFITDGDEPGGFGSFAGDDELACPAVAGLPALSVASLAGGILAALEELNGIAGGTSAAGGIESFFKNNEALATPSLLSACPVLPSVGRLLSSFALGVTVSAGCSLST